MSPAPAPWASFLEEMGSQPLRLDHVKAMLAARGPAAPPEWTIPDARAAAVLVPLFEHEGQLKVLLTRRSSNLRNHRGDVAFPGGRQEPGEEPVQAALREAREELGIFPGDVEVLGELDWYTTVVSKFVVAPFVGALRSPPRVLPNPAEIERVFDVPLAELLEDGVYREEVWELPWGERTVSFFELEGETVWGATARILRQLLVLLTAAQVLA